MKNTLLYVKDIGLFSLIQVLIIFICSVLNILFLSEDISTIILLLSNIIYFAIIGFRAAKISQRKGLTIGLTNGVILSLMLYIIFSIFNGLSINISKTIYYIILTLASIFGAVSGKNVSKKTSK